MNCFRFFGFRTLDEVNRLSFKEYDLLVKAENLKQVDIDYRVHQLAWLPIIAKGQKRVGKNKLKYVYDKFEKFYDHNKAVKAVLGKKEEKSNGIFTGYEKYLKERGCR